MREDGKLMSCLNGLPTDDEPLTEAELARLTRTVLSRTGCRPAVKTRRRRGPVWARVLVSGAACAVLLVGINGWNPALAEGLPLLGNVFAYFNSLPKGYLQGNDLSEYAQSACVEAEARQTPSKESGNETEPQIQAVAGKEASENSCVLTISQIYCDELYLRVGLVLTAEDDALAEFDTVTIDPPLLEESTSREEANTLYGGITLNGQPVGNDLLPCFRKQDDHTFFCEMQYSLQDYTGETEAMQASLTFSHLVGVTLGDGAVGSEHQTPIDGTYCLEFTVSADASLTRMGTFSAQAQNGIELTSVTATPGETRVVYTRKPSLPETVSPALQVFLADGTRLQGANGNYRDEGGDTVVTEYLDAVPEGVTSLTVRVVDKNDPTLAVLAEWAVTLP